MPLCGFDEQMLKGLGMFYRGLAQAVERKATERNITVNGALEIELSDMDAFLAELPRVRDDNLRESLIGLTRYSKAFYAAAVERAEKSQRSLSSAFVEVSEELRMKFTKLDSQFYGKLEGKSSEPMRELVDYINKEIK